MSSLFRLLKTLPMALAAMVVSAEYDRGAVAYEDTLSGDMSIFESGLPEGAVCSFIDGQSNCGPDALQMSPIAGKPETRSAGAAVADREIYIPQTVALLVKAGFEPLQATAAEGVAVLHTRVVTDDANFMAELLFAFAPFPEIRDRLLQEVTQEDLPRQKRFARFKAQAGVLAETAWALLQEEVSSREGKTYAGMLHVWNGTPEGERILTPKGRGQIGEKRDTARIFLLELKNMMERELGPEGLAKKQGIPVRAPAQAEQPPTDDGFPVEAAFAGRPASRAEAVNALWRNRHRSGSLDTVRSALESERGTPDERLMALAISLTAPSTTVDEAFSYIALAPDASALAKRWRYSGDQLEGARYLHPLSPALASALKPSRHGVRLVSLKEAAHRPGKAGGNHREKSPQTAFPASGMTVERLGKAPNFTSTGHFYLLVEDPLDVPQALRHAVFNGAPVFDGTPLGLMKEGPRLVPLHPESASDRELLQWFGSEGAKKGNAVLVSSKDNLENLARRMAGWHLLDVNGTGMLANPAKGRMLGYLVESAQGSAVELFGGGDTSLWFMEPEDEGWTWFFAGGPKSGVPAVQATPPPVMMLSLDEAQAAALEAVLGENKSRILAYSLASRQKLPGTSEKENTREAVRIVRKYEPILMERFAGAPYLERRKSLELLWRGHVAGVLGGVEHILFAGGADLSELNIRVEGILLSTGG